MTKTTSTFWVTNTCNRNVSLADLNVTIPAFGSVNLLDKKHYSYTLEQLEKSRANGSIFKKSAIIKVREVPPIVIEASMPFLKETFIPSRERSILPIKEERYEELEISDEDQKKIEEDYAKQTVEEDLEIVGTNKPLIVSSLKG